MGCCGCTLQTTAIVAAVFGIIESVAGVIAGIVYLAQGWLAVNYYPYSTIRNVLISGVVFNVLWLIATIILIIGIVKENAVMHRIWVGATSTIMVVDLAHTIALVVGVVNAIPYMVRYSSSSYSSYYYYDSGWIFGYVMVMTAVSRGSTIWLWVINICLTIYTAHRANEIERGPLQPATTVFVYGNQPVQPYPIAGQTIIVQHGGPVPGMQPNYPHQQPQYGQSQTNQYGQPQTNQYGQPQTNQYGQPQTNQYGQPPTEYGQQPPQYGQPPDNPNAPDQGIPPKY